MTLTLTDRQAAARRSFREVFDRVVGACAADLETTATVERSLLDQLTAAGCFGVAAPPAIGGGEDVVTLGLLFEQAGRVSSSVRSILTAHHMVAHAIARCGTADQRQRWLPELASGRRLAAFCLTEAEAGSDPAGIATSAVQEGADYVLDGEKKWTTGAQTAGLFLVIAKSAGAPVAFLVDAAASGVSVRPTARLLGTRASMLGDVRFDRCAVPAADRIGPPGFGLSHVAATALDMGRYGVAWGCVGLIQACVDASRRHAQERRQFGHPLLEHQLVRRMISDMTTDLRAARLLALHAGQLKDAGDPEAPLETVAAKYFASRAARRAAADTVQIHGAAGCLDASEAARLYRDAKIMEIIEGSNEINQIGIAGWSDADE